MIDKLKKFGPPALLAYAGIEASKLVAVKSRGWAIGLALAGSLGGVFLANALAKK